MAIPAAPRLFIQKQLLGHDELQFDPIAKAAKIRTSEAQEPPGTDTLAIDMNMGEPTRIAEKLARSRPHLRVCGERRYSPENIFRSANT